MKFVLENGQFIPRRSIKRNSAYQEIVFGHNFIEKAPLDVSYNVEKGDIIVQILLESGYDTEVKVQIVRDVKSDCFFTEDIFFGTLSEAQILRKNIRKVINNCASDIHI